MVCRDPTVTKESTLSTLRLPGVQSLAVRTSLKFSASQIRLAGIGNRDTTQAMAKLRRSGPGTG